MPHTYTYSVADDTANGAVADKKLHDEVAVATVAPMGGSADIDKALNGVSIDGDDIHIEFVAEPSAESKTNLDGIVAAHDGVPYPANPLPPVAPSGAPLMKLDAPEEADGKPVMVMSPAPEGLLTFFTGRGDDSSPTPPASGRGTGDPIRVSIGSGETFPGDFTGEWKYNEPTWVHDGQLNWNPNEFDHDDHFSLSVKIPATTVTPNGSTEGNCNLVATGLGYNMIVPAAGDGTHDVDLETVSPVPNGMDPNGYWDVDEVTGAVTPAANPGSANWYLLDVEVKSYFIRCVPMGHSLGVYDVDVYKTEWVSERWTWALDVHKESAPSEDTALSGWLMLYREKTT